MSQALIHSSFPACRQLPGRHAQRLAHAGRRQRSRLLVTDALKLVSIGEGTCDHLGTDTEVPKADDISLKPGNYEVGREDADITIGIPTVSSRHAKLRVEGNKVSVTDLNSTNGTYHNGEELQPMQTAQIAVGDELTFGDMFLARFVLRDEPEQSASSEA